MKFLSRISIAMFLFVSSCQEDSSDFTFEDISEDSVSTLQASIDSLSQDTTILMFGTPADPNSQRITWMNILKGCYSSDLLDRSLVNTNLLFLGASSNMYLGTVVDKKVRNNKFDVKTELKYLIPASDFSQFATVGESVNNCDLTKVRDISLDAFLSGVVTQGAGKDSIGASISHWDSIKVTSGKWQIDYIRESDFIRYLKKNKSKEDIAYYWDVVFNNKNTIITKVVKVSGFSAEAFYQDTLSAGVQASLEKPVTLTVVDNKGEAEKDNGLTAQITFKKTSSKKISISSTNSFYIFGNVKKAKKMD